MVYRLLKIHIWTNQQTLIYFSIYIIHYLSFFFCLQISWDVFFVVHECWVVHSGLPRDSRESWWHLKRPLLEQLVGDELRRGRVSSQGRDRGHGQSLHVLSGVVETVNAAGNSAWYSRSCGIMGSESRFDCGPIAFCWLWRLRARPPPPGLGQGASNVHIL
jgi:hypothetical protein